MAKKKVTTSYEIEEVKNKARGKILDAVFFKDSKKPICPKCLIPLSHEVADYGLNDYGYLYFVSGCKACDKFSKYITDASMEVIKTKIVERE